MDQNGGKWSFAAELCPDRQGRLSFGCVERRSVREGPGEGLADAADGSNGRRRLGYEVFVVPTRRLYPLVRACDKLVGD